MCFNSNMVRLKGHYKMGYELMSFEFQFQYGSIKRALKSNKIHV